MGKMIIIIFLEKSPIFSLFRKQKGILWHAEAHDVNPTIESTNVIKFNPYTKKKN